MASGGQRLEEDLISKQLEGFHISMDESDDYIPDIIPQTAGQSQQMSAGAHLSTAADPNVIGTPFVHQQQVAQVHSTTCNLPANNPAAPQVPPGEPVLKFFGGYSTNPTDHGVPTTTPTGPNTSGIGSATASRDTRALHTEADVASKVSFRSLHPAAQQNIPSYTAHSDPRNMSTIIEATYAPTPRSNNEFLALLPNLADMRKPMPMNMTPEEVILLYDTLMTHRQCNAAAVVVDPKEQDLYGGSVNALPADWLYHPERQQEQQQQQQVIPPPLVAPAQLPPLQASVQPVAAPQVQSATVPPPQVAVHQAQLPPIGQQNVPVQVQMPVQPSGQQPILTTKVPPSHPVTIQQPANPVLQSALYQAMTQQGNTVMMDDVANFVISSDVSLNLKSINPKSISEDTKDSDNASDSASSSTSSETCRR